MESQGGRTRSQSRGRRGNLLSEDSPPVVGIFIEQAQVDDAISQRLNVLDELLNTERDYLNDLRVIVEKYQKPILEQKLLVADEAAKIFSNIQDLVQLHSHLYEQLQEKINDVRYMQKIEHCVTEIFSSSVEELKGYSTYSANYKRSLRRVSKMSEKFPPFAAFLQSAQDQDKLKLRLIDYLIKPIQRLCKYPLIFRELLKKTPIDHVDYRFMTETMNQLENITTYVNEETQQAEHMKKLKGIQKLISGYDGLVVPGRSLRHEGMLEVTVDKEKPKLCKVYLFNDIMLIGRYKAKKKHQITHVIPMTGILLIPEFTDISVALKESPGVSVHGAMTVPGSNGSPGSPLSSSSSSSSSSSLSSSPSSRSNRGPLRKGHSLVQLSSIAHPGGGSEFFFQIVGIEIKKKFTIRCESIKERHEWTTKIEDNIDYLLVQSGSNLDLTPEEELNRERAARKMLQERNEELNRKIMDLQRRLDEETRLRKSLEDKLKRRANSLSSSSPPSSPSLERTHT